MTNDLRMRSIAKALSWRIVATCTTMVIVFLVTGRPSLTLGVGVFEVVSKLALYYLHERIWNAVWWGKSATAERLSKPTILRRQKRPGGKSRASALPG